MIRSKFIIPVQPCIDDNANSSGPVVILSPKETGQCTYCHAWIVKDRWFSIDPVIGDRFHFCSMKCMWIFSRNGYRLFEVYITRDSKQVVKKIKQNSPRSLRENTSCLKASEIDIERLTVVDSITKLIQRVDQRPKKKFVVVTKVVPVKKYSPADWMAICRAMRDAVRGPQPSSEKTSEPQPLPLEVML